MKVSWFEFLARGCRATHPLPLYDERHIADLEEGEPLDVFIPLIEKDIPLLHHCIPALHAVLQATVAGLKAANDRQGLPSCARSVFGIHSHETPASVRLGLFCAPPPYGSHNAECARAIRQNF